MPRGQACAGASLGERCVDPRSLDRHTLPIELTFLWGGHVQREKEEYAKAKALALREQETYERAREDGCRALLQVKMVKVLRCVSAGLGACGNSPGWGLGSDSLSAVRGERQPMCRESLEVLCGFRVQGVDLPIQ